MFRFELDEYAAERIDIGHIKYHNNQPCIDMFEQVHSTSNYQAFIQIFIQAPLGLIRIVDEECKFPKATDSSLLSKLEQNFSSAITQVR